jgi:hypothetical protein
MGLPTDILHDYDRQAELLGNYLLQGIPLKPEIKERYEQTMLNTTGKLDERDKKILSFALNHPWSIGLLDAGCVFVHPDAEIRRRLYVMFAILEASTDYWSYFLPKKRNPLYVFVLLAAGMRGVAKAGVGVILVKSVR